MALNWSVYMIRKMKEKNFGRQSLLTGIAMRPFSFRMWENIMTIHIV